MSPFNQLTSNSNLADCPGTESHEKSQLVKLERLESFQRLLCQHAMTPHPQAKRSAADSVLAMLAYEIGGDLQYTCSPES